MPSVVGIGSAVPEYQYSIEEVLKVGETWLEKYPEKLALFKKFVISSKAQKRNFFIPSTEMLAIGGMQERSRMFEECAAPLGAQALRAAIENAKVESSVIKSLIFTSCTCPSIPSVDALIIEGIGLNRTVNRIPIYQHGCAGGVVGLRLAAELCKVQGLVALTSVELCSLVFQKNNPTAAQLVGAAIFADGAASVLVSSEEKGLVIRAGQSFLVPESRHLMGYDLLDDGTHLRLDRNLPQALIAVAPDTVNTFLNSQGLKSEQIAHWLFHPGGTKILDFLENTFCSDSSQSPWARRILNSVGNLSSATILFVLKEFLEAKFCKKGDKIVMVGVGPGLTLELILFEWLD